MYYRPMLKYCTHFLGFQRAALESINAQQVRPVSLQRFPIDGTLGAILPDDGNEMFGALAIAVHPYCFGARTKHWLR